MSTRTPSTSTQPVRTLVSSVTCPHCWAEFPPAQVRFVAEHAALQGDAVLGESAAMRFLPSRFDARGRAIDPLGATASRMACMRCHLEVPPAALELPQAIVSIVGAPASGKSVMLAAASFSLRSGLVVDGLEFIDADPSLNDLTLELESSLFRSSTPDRPAMIAKTDLAGRLYRSFRVGDANWTAPKPQLFVVGRGSQRRLLCLYDNAGEHFLPGADAPHEPVTRHLGVSRSLIFVVDPTQDQRVIERLGGREAVQAVGGAGSIDQRQDLILIEVANRVRRLRGLSAFDRLPFRIVLALSKADIWGAVTEPPIAADFGGYRAGKSIAVPPKSVLKQADATCRDFLSRYMPELLATARALDPDLRIVPFSGLGHPPSSATRGERLAIRPRDVNPVWPAAPLVVALAEAEPTLFPEHASK
jgi:hypothetical protein